LGLLGQFTKLRRATNNSFSLTLAVGGWTWSKNFSPAVATDSSRHSLAQSIVDLFTQWSCFQGVSIDWEYLSSDGVNYGNAGNIATRADCDNFAKFLEILRHKFNEKGWHHYRIAMCCTPAPAKIKFDIKRLVPLLDEWHIMTYEYSPSPSNNVDDSFASGAWSHITAHQSNLLPTRYTNWSASGSAEAYISRGVPPEKIFIGAPFYSRGFANSGGLGKPASGVSPDKSWEEGVVDYKSLPIPGAVEMYDEAAQASYSYDAHRKVFNSYDNPRAVKAKCEYIKKKGLGGLIIWESRITVRDDG
jgi:chitinase